jgi:hypothetical protein
MSKQLDLQGERRVASTGRTGGDDVNTPHSPLAFVSSGYLRAGNLLLYWLSRSRVRRFGLCFLDPVIGDLGGGFWPSGTSYCKVHI